MSNLMWEKQLHHWLFYIVQFQELEELGYHAFAFGTYGDAVELVGTLSALKCYNSQN